ncbi:hypothetical protein C2G38_2174659 [Gigaspora rosea]|uniref:Uncharacterized protein n=1 Tax=Gigaspora rosea TaxID=44941 RepID=A0A397VJZ7_9GLOM|nr:hypothetical protein C2G38_2174659 [Gigaspora rosea]
MKKRKKKKNRNILEGWDVVYERRSCLGATPGGKLFLPPPSWILSVLKISENDSREDQPEIIELSSDEDQIPDLIEISSDEQGQIPEIIDLSIDEELLFEKGQIAVSRDRTPEAANIKLNL